MRILVLCTGNSCRSQMAEGFLRKFARDSLEVFSAGLDPTAVHSLATRVMGEVGVDISRHKSKHFNEFLNQQFDYVITVCDDAAEHCPTFPGNAVRLHWPSDDPAAATGTEAEILDEFRRVRDDIGQKVMQWLLSLKKSS